MVILNKLRVPIPTARNIEDMNANVQKSQADIEYVAMMCDVDIPTEESEVSDVRED